VHDANRRGGAGRLVAVQRVRDDVAVLDGRRRAGHGLAVHHDAALEDGLFIVRGGDEGTRAIEGRPAGGLAACRRPFSARYAKIRAEGANATAQRGGRWGEREGCAHKHEGTVGHLHASRGRTCAVPLLLATTPARFIVLTPRVTALTTETWLQRHSRRGSAATTSSSWNTGPDGGSFPLASPATTDGKQERQRHVPPPQQLHLLLPVRPSPCMTPSTA
jgi:hypothetical protein